MAKLIFARPIFMVLANQKFTRIGKFVLIGGSLFLLSDLMLHKMVGELDAPIEVAYPIITVILYVLQFALNAIFTWADRKANLAENLRRVAAYVPIKAGLWLCSQGAFIVWYWLGTSTWNPMPFEHRIANALTTGTIMVLNYVAFDKVVFKKKGEA